MSSCNDLLFVFLVVFLQKLFSNCPNLLWLSNMPKFYFSLRSFYHTTQKKRYQIEKVFLVFLLILCTEHSVLLAQLSAILVTDVILVFLALWKLSAWTFMAYIQTTQDEKTCHRVTALLNDKYCFQCFRVYTFALVQISNHCFKTERKSKILQELIVEPP